MSCFTRDTSRVTHANSKTRKKEGIVISTNEHLRVVIIEKDIP